ncbi:MAG: hypothetical protein ABSG04_14985, partial [Verrucomicrobiota bacterium]
AIHFIVIRFPFGSLFFFIRTTTFYRKETFLATSPLMLSNHVFAQNQAHPIAPQVLINMQVSSLLTLFELLRATLLRRD